MVARCTGVLGAVMMTLFLAGCLRSGVTLRPAPLGAQAVSLLGDTLWSVPITISEAQARLDALNAARRDHAARPDRLYPMLLVARHTAGMGRLREAFDLYTEALVAFPDEARIYRRRGEIFLQLRDLDQAVNELRIAVQRTRGSPAAKEYMAVPGGGGVVGTGLFFTSARLLGIAYYARGEFDKAAAMLTEALHGACDADEVAAAAIWLYFAFRRAGRTSDAVAILRAVPAEYPVLRRGAEHRLIRFLRGELSLDSLRVRVVRDRDPDEEALYLYGLGFALLIQGQAEDARLTFEQVLVLGNWTALPYLAAEAELARLRFEGAKVGTRRREGRDVVEGTNESSRPSREPAGSPPQGGRPPSPRRRTPR